MSIYDDGIKRPTYEELIAKEKHQEWLNSLHPDVRKVYDDYMARHAPVVEPIIEVKVEPTYVPLSDDIIYTAKEVGKIILAIAAVSLLGDIGWFAGP